jgi:hypothetical protein
MEVKTMLEPRLAQLHDDMKTFLITRGGQQIQYYPFKAQSASNSNFVFKCDPTSPSAVVDRNVILQATATIDIDFKSLGDFGDTNKLLRNNAFALRAYPISSITSNLILTINGSSISTQLSSYVHMLSRFNNTSESRTSFGSIFPNALDSYYNYSDEEGGLNNAFNNYADSIPGSYMPRGAYNMVVSANPSPANINDTYRATITIPLYEYVNISPFYQRSQEGCGGLCNVQNMTVNFNLSNLSRMFSLNTPHNITAFKVNFGESPTIFVGFITAPIDFEIPRSINFAYNAYNYYATTFDTIAAGSTGMGTTNVIQFSQLPEKIYMCVKKKIVGNADDCKLSDTFLPINSVNINFGNQVGIQSNSSQANLYLQSVLNGCNMNWNEWYGKTNGNLVVVSGLSTTIPTVGGIIAFEFGRDIPLQGLDCPSMSGSWNFSVTITCGNYTGADTANYEICLLTVTNGILTCEYPSTSYLTLGIVSPQQVLEAEPSHMSYDDVQRMYGGSAGSNIRRFFQRFGPIMADVGKAIGRVVAPRLTSVLENVVPEIRTAIHGDVAHHRGGLPGGMSAGAHHQMNQRGNQHHPIHHGHQTQVHEMHHGTHGGLRAGALEGGLRAGALEGGRSIAKKSLRDRAY